MLRNVRDPPVVVSKRARSALLPNSDFDDDVLLSPNSSVPRSLAFFPTKELKYYDTALEATNVVSPGVFSTSNLFVNPTAGGLVSTPPRGDAGNERSSRRILMKNLHISGLLTLDYVPVAFAPPISLLVCILVVLDTQTNGAQCTTQDIFSDPITGVDYRGLFPPLRNMASNTRYQVLYSEVLSIGKNRTFTIDTTAVPAEFSYSGDVVAFQKFIPMDYFCTFNNGTTADVANVVDRSIHVLAVQTGGHQVILDYKCRLRFADYVF